MKCCTCNNCCHLYFLAACGWIHRINARNDDLTSLYLNWIFLCDNLARLQLFLFSVASKPSLNWDKIRWFFFFCLPQQLFYLSVVQFNLLQLIKRLGFKSTHDLKRKEKTIEKHLRFNESRFLFEVIMSNISPPIKMMI